MIKKIILASALAVVGAGHGFADGLTLEQSMAAASGADTDADGISNLDDLCPAIADPLQADFDGDGVGDVCDMCPNQPAPGYINGCTE